MGKLEGGMVQGRNAGRQEGGTAQRREGRKAGSFLRHESGPTTSSYRVPTLGRQVG